MNTFLNFTNLSSRYYFSRLDTFYLFIFETRLPPIREINRFEHELENISGNISILTISSKPLIPNEIWYGNQAWKRPYRVSGVRADHHDPFDAPFVCGNRTRRER